MVFGRVSSNQTAFSRLHNEWLAGECGFLFLMVTFLWCVFCHSHRCWMEPTFWPLCIILLLAETVDRLIHADQDIGHKKGGRGHGSPHTHCFGKPKLSFPPFLSLPQVGTQNYFWWVKICYTKCDKKRKRPKKDREKERAYASSLTCCCNNSGCKL